MLAQARLHEERMRRDGERELREHEEHRDEIRAHLAHVRATLASLTGREGSPSYLAVGTPRSRNAPPSQRPALPVSCRVPGSGAGPRQVVRFRAVRAFRHRRARAPSRRRGSRRRASSLRRNRRRGT